MVLFKKTTDLVKHLHRANDAKNSIGFVPTMGALHQGHLSLIQKSKEETGTTVCSVFINPTQFNNPEDLKKYPVTLEQDIYLLEKSGCDILFLPDIKEIYPDGTDFTKHYELGNLENILEGKYRPGHFQGVCQVMNSLLKIVSPDHLFLGQKDYQQCLVIKKLGTLIKERVVINICPTMRESNGLAMSSRNLRLNDKEKMQASEIFKCLCFMRDNVSKGDVTDLKQAATDTLKQNGFVVDYAEIANAENLSTVITWDGEEKLVLLIAAYLNDVRLIDNLLPASQNFKS
ncbi:MAG: pantoate--beta-alanine ligase [Chitinophagaceae bacterium]|nr:pantoate--beta-alanine ligase [Chitinophagaceae bacterium]